MADISAYPNIQPKKQDLIVGSETYVAGVAEVTGNPTRNFTVGSIASLANSINLGYTVYAALISQTGTAAPVATVLQNTTSGTIAWTRDSAGIYTATASSAIFTANKTAVIINQGSSSSTSNIEWASGTTSTVTIDTTADGVLTVGFIEVRIYA